MTDLLAKKCTKCGEWKEQNAFPIVTIKSVTGRRARCRECDAKCCRDMRSRLRARKRIDVPATQICGQCKVEQPSISFSHDRSRGCGLAWNCRACQAAAKKKKLDEDPLRVVDAREYAKRLSEREDQKIKSRKRRAIRHLRYIIAVATCEKLGVNLTKLATERYNAEHKSDKRKG